MGLIAGVSGVRGVVGTDLTARVAVEIGCAVGTWLGGRRAIVARDTRPSGQMLKCAVEAGLLACGCAVIDLDIVTTPGAALSLTALGAAGGIVVTASHNPPEYNGIKILTERGWAPPPDEAERIYSLWRDGSFSLADAAGCGTISQDTIWYSGVVYVVTCDLTVQEGVTLTVLPEAVVKLSPGVSLVARGRLLSQGTEADPVIFTSLADDAHGGDTNGDGDATIPQAGDWESIIVNGTASLNHTEIYYGGPALSNNGALTVSSWVPVLTATL